MTGLTGYTIRQAAYDLRKLRGKGLAYETPDDHRSIDPAAWADEAQRHFP